MARVLNRTEMAVYLYAYRHRIALRQTVKNPLMRNLVEIKFGNVEYFHPTKEFYKKTGISQRRWVSLVLVMPNLPKKKCWLLPENFVFPWRRRLN